MVAIISQRQYDRVLKGESLDAIQAEPYDHDGSPVFDMEQAEHDIQDVAPALNPAPEPKTLMDINPVPEPEEPEDYDDEDDEDANCTGQYDKSWLKKEMAKGKTYKELSVEFGMDIDKIRETMRKKVV